MLPRIPVIQSLACRTATHIGETRDETRRDHHMFTDNQSHKPFISAHQRRSILIVTEWRAKRCQANHDTQERTCTVKPRMQNGIMVRSENPTFKFNCCPTSFRDRGLLNNQDQNLFSQWDVSDTKIPGRRRTWCRSMAFGSCIGGSLYRGADISVLCREGLGKTTAVKMKEKGVLTSACRHVVRDRRPWRVSKSWE